MGATLRAALPVLCAASLIGAACAGGSGAKRALEPDRLRAELARRLGTAAVPVPFEVGEDAVAHARGQLSRVAYSRDRIQRLVDLLTREPPEGFGVEYRWWRTATAAEALAEGEGNCMSLASVLVGLARGLGWQAWYAEAGDPEEERRLEANLGVLADHIAVVIETDEERAVVDFLGPVEGRPLRIIDDLRAVGHFLNNRAFEEIVAAQREDREVPWASVARRFEQVTRVDPDSARAWNNLGIALAREGRADEARRAYVRAHMLDPGLSSPERNLRVLRTRLAGEAATAVEAVPEAKPAP